MITQRFISALLGLCLVLPAVASQPSQYEGGQLSDSDVWEEGWHWYKDPKEDDDIPPPLETPAPQALSPTEQKAVLHQATMAALDKAILYPTVENFRRFSLLQRFWTEQATAFAQISKKALLQHPELDYNLVRSHYNGTAAAQQAMEKTKQTQAVASLAERYGLFFFYRGGNPVDNLMAGVIRSWCAERGISLMAISVDGQISEALPESRTDSGQAERMGVKFFPATFMVEPKTQSYQPLAWGFMSHDDLDRRVVNILNNFKADF